jgi:hypothetical protein
VPGRRQRLRWARRMKAIVGTGYPDGGNPIILE